MASMLNGNTWSNNHYFMADVGNRFWWGGTYNFAQFTAATHETGSVSQTYPNEADWLTGTPVDTNPAAAAAASSSRESPALNQF